MLSNYKKEELFMKIDWAIVSIFVSVLSFIVAFYFYKWVKSLPAKNEKIENVLEKVLLHS